MFDENSRSDSIKSETIPSPVSFASFKLPADLIKGIEAAGFKDPSPIQQQAIPHVTGRGDLIGQAQTGSGKTAAFVIPTLAALKFNRTVEILVVVPTRELSEQVVQEFLRLGKYMRLNVVSVVGGQSSYRQIEQVNRGAQVVVGTPGRLLDHLSSNKLKNFAPQTVILDEADEMLDMGFIDDIRKILGFTPKDRQTLLFSATMPPPIARLAKEHLTNPLHLSLTSQKEAHADIEQRVFMVRDHQREQALVRIIEDEAPKKAVIFCRTKRDTITLHESLTRRGYKVQALHGDLSQGERTRAMTEIKKCDRGILVATDVASRGLDIEDLSHVINYQMPDQTERYTHRIGRTGRAGQKGTALSLVTPGELRSLRYLNRGGHIQVSELASRTDVQTKKDEGLLTELENLPVNPRAYAACEKMLENCDDEHELLLKMYTYILKDRKVSGPEDIGLDKSEAEKIFKGGRSRPPFKKGGRGGKPPFKGGSKGMRFGPKRGGPKSDSSKPRRPKRA